MRTRSKILIIVIPIVAFVAILAIAGSQPYINKNMDEVAGITQFYVIDDGSVYKIRFSLVDDKGYVAASDANVLFDPGSGDEAIEFPVSASEFREYKLQLTGQPVYAYAWQVAKSDMIIDSGDAYIQVTLPNGKSFSARG